MLYVVATTPGPGVTGKTIQNALMPAHSWYRFAPTSWIICTDEEASYWSERLKPFVKGGGKLFICRLDVSDRQGWMAREFWTWLREHADDGE